MKTTILTTLFTTIFIMGGGKILAQYQQTLLSESWVGSGGLNLNFYQNLTTTDDSGNVYVAGSTINTSGNSDMLLQKFNYKGDLLWIETYNGAANLNDMATAMYIDNSNNIYLTGSATNTDSTGTDLAVLKYNASGTLQWSYFYGGTSSIPDDVGTGLIGDNSGRIFVCGSTATDSTAYDFITIGLNASSGAYIWSNTYDYANLGEMPCKIIYSALFGKVIVVGASQSSLTPVNWNLTTINYNATSGSQQSVSRTSSNTIQGLDGVYDITLDNAGNIYITGTAYISSSYDVSVYKLNSNLNLIWEKYYDGNGLEDRGKGIRVDDNGNVFVVGSVGTTTEGKNVGIVKYDSGGNLLWNREYFGLAGLDDQGIQLAIADTNHIYFTAAVNDNGYSDYKVFGINSNGDLFVNTTFDGTSHMNDSPDAITIDNDGNIIITGKSQTGVASFENKTVKYSIFERNYDFVYEDSTPVYLDNNLLIKFNPDNINMSTIDKRKLLAGTLDEFIDSTALNEIESKFGKSWAKLNTFKVYKNFTSADSLSISRLGDTIRYGQFYTLLSVDIAIDSMDLVLDSLPTCNSVIYTQPNLLYSPTSTTVDEQFSTYQLSLYPNITYPEADINASGAWDIETGGNLSTKVAVIDCPINYMHEDINGLQSAIGPANKIGGGYNAFNNWNLEQIPYFSTDYATHGTKVAGVIGAHRNNYLSGTTGPARGVAGIAGGNQLSQQGAQLYTLGFSNFEGGGTSENLVECMHIAFTNNPLTDYPNINHGYGVDIINFSWASSGYNGNGNDTPVLDELKDCFRNQCTFVAARGQSFTLDENVRLSPACNTDDLLITVIASGTNGERKIEHDAIEGNGSGNWHSMYGITGAGNYMNRCDCDVMAPGTVEMVSTTTSFDPIANIPDAGYTNFDMTSAAAPHVTGVASLMLNHHRPETNIFYPNRLAPEDIENIIEKTAEDKNTAGFDLETAYGLTNANNALIKVNDPYYVIHSPHIQVTTTNDYSGSVQVLTNIFEGNYVPSGTYTGTRKKHSFTIQMDLPLGHEIIDWWWLQSRFFGGTGLSSTLILGNEVNDPTPAAEITYQNIVIGSSSATLSGYFYTWDLYGYGHSYISFPRPVEELNTAFSLHVYKHPDASLNEMGMDNFLIYPNPSSESIRVSFPLEHLDIEKITICDAIGRTVQFIENKTTENIEISINSLTKGMYYLSIYSSEGKISTKPFIKN